MVLVLSQSRRTHSLLDSTASIEIACDFALYSLSLGLEFGGGTLEENSSLQRKVRDLVHGNERDIVRFFYTSAKCACLKDRHKTEKRIGNGILLLLPCSEGT